MLHLLITLALATGNMMADAMVGIAVLLAFTCLPLTSEYVPNLEGIFHFKYQKSNRIQHHLNTRFRQTSG
jgi:hypothetical protein